MRYRESRPFAPIANVLAKFEAGIIINFDKNRRAIQFIEDVPERKWYEVITSSIMKTALLRLIRVLRMPLQDINFSAAQLNLVG